VLAFAKVDVDQAQDIAAAYGVSATATFLFLKEGNRPAVIALHGSPCHGDGNIPAEEYAARPWPLGISMINGV
jgi:hypothetical protein